MASMTSPGQRQGQAAVDELAAYIAKAQAAVAAGKIRPQDLTATCTECGVEATEIYNDDEAYHETAQTLDGTLVVILGCEGYWIINPASLGYTDRPNWQDWKLDMPEMALERVAPWMDQDGEPIVDEDTERSLHITILGKHVTEIREITNEQMWFVGYRDGVEIEVSIKGPMLRMISEHFARD